MYNRAKVYKSNVSTSLGVFKENKMKFQLNKDKITHSCLSPCSYLARKSKYSMKAYWKDARVSYQESVSV